MFRCPHAIRRVVVKEINPLHYPLLDIPILDSSNSAANKDMISKIWTNGIQLPDRVENIVGKGGIACYKQFLLFPQWFQKLSPSPGGSVVSVSDS